MRERKGEYKREREKHEREREIVAKYICTLSSGS